VVAKTDPFEKYSNEYDLWFDQHSDYYRAELEAIRLLIPSPEAEGMEVGVGSGKSLIDGESPGIILEGFCNGSFVVIRGVKTIE
jgi:hypothetical protein